MPSTSPIAVAQIAASKAETPAKKAHQSATVGCLARTSCVARTTRHWPTTNSAKAAFRRLRGEAELAALFQRKTEAAERVAADLEAQAFARRLEAAGLQASLARRAELSDALRTIAA
jgi:hypothetical protein